MNNSKPRMNTYNVHDSSQILILRFFSGQPGRVLCELLMGFNPPTSPRVAFSRLGDGEDTTHLVKKLAPFAEGKFQLLQLYTQAGDGRRVRTLELDETSMVEWKVQIGFFFNRHGIVFVCGVPDKLYPLLRGRVSSFFILRSM
ncbi:hypothetical protein SPFM6_00049 [Salmonella phage SPFM6]|nr:hypothetical protein SPFM6_00049 [Salmonella phage SPFM6]